jgi:para-aminobenzoate synthetase
MSIVIIDNYDSFTYNLFQLVAGVADTHVQVIRNDDYSAWDSISPASLEALIISPGPGRPEFEPDFGISRLALNYDVPLLGVCLGHQGLCYFAGGVVATAPEPCHGQTSPIQHNGTGLFAGIPAPFSAVRYHSLVVDDVPETVKVTALTTDPSGEELVMGVEHRFRAQWGVQFHPESIETEHGRLLIENFLRLARGRLRQHNNTATPAVAAFPTRRIGRQPDPQTKPGRFSLVKRRLDYQPDAEALYAQLFAGQDGAFWLDSSMIVDGLSRFSILGGIGPHGEWVTAEANCGVRVHHGDGTITQLTKVFSTTLESKLLSVR